MSTSLRQLAPALRSCVLLVLTVVLGLAYPLVDDRASPRSRFPASADGSLVTSSTARSSARR